MASCTAHRTTLTTGDGSVCHWESFTLLSTASGAEPAPPDAGTP